MAGCANSTRHKLVRVESTIKTAIVAATPVAIHHGRLNPRSAEVGVQAYSKNSEPNADGITDETDHGRLQ